MKTRILSGVIGIFLMSLVLFFYNTIVLNLAVSVVCAIMVYEIFCATKMIKEYFFVFLAAVFYAIIFPLSKFGYLNGVLYVTDYRIFVTSVYVILNLLFLLKRNKSVKVCDMFFCCACCILITILTSNIIYIRDKFSLFEPCGLYYIILFFVIPWTCDAGAYFVGVKFGKNKLAPNISPKKTIEGAVGGVIFSFLSVFIYNVIFLSFFSFKLGVNIFFLCIITILGAIFSIVGDLSVSVFKRQNNVKDFGNILKGQGGLLDRFDSWFLVSAILYPVVKVFPVLLPIY